MNPQQPYQSLISRVCPSCGSGTRLIGIEPHPTEPTVDVCTYACGTCNHMFTQTANRTELRVTH